MGLALRLDHQVGGSQPNVGRDTLELSRLAKRLHYLDNLYCNGLADTNDEGTGAHDLKVATALQRATAIADAYYYGVRHQVYPNPLSYFAGGPRGTSLYLVHTNSKRHGDEAVPAWLEGLAVPF